MAHATLEDARQVTSTIVQTIDPQLVLAFGSVARTGRGNDLDLLIVVDGELREEALATALKPFAARIAIDPLIVDSATFRERFRGGSPFLSSLVREGRRLYMRNAESSWLQDAREELRSADYLALGGFWKAACYHAQQAVEKAFKAWLLARGWELEKVHSVRRLAAIAVEFRVPVPLDDAAIDYIDSIYRGRYPGEAGLLPLGDPREEDARRAIEIARLLFT
jgi:HEPN domain-containing protein